MTQTQNLRRVAFVVTALLAIGAPISRSGEWLDVQGMTAGENGGVRVTRYREATPALVDLLPEIAGAAISRQLAVSTARTAAGGSISSPQIVEAVRKLDTAVVQAWL